MPSSSELDWKAWPGGNADTSLNPGEKFTSSQFGLSGNCTWEVWHGPIDAIIVETGTNTATNRSMVTVRYDTKSPTNSEADTVWVRCTQGSVSRFVKRTVFSGEWTLTFDYPSILHTDDKLRFDNDSGGSLNAVEFNWEGERGATRIAGRMEAIFTFQPSNINWAARGVSFVFSQDGGGGKFSCRLQREAIIQWVYWRKDIDPVRVIGYNDAGWAYDGNSDILDAQYPTPLLPNRAFRIDAPGFRPADVRPGQAAMRSDFRELLEWHDGTAWRVCSRSPVWYFAGTAIKDGATKGGVNAHGTGGAPAIPNTQPSAQAGPDQCVVKSTTGNPTTVLLSGAASTDSDPDALVGYLWTQLGGPAVTFDDPTSDIPTFVAPNVTGTVGIQLKVTDLMSTLHFHRPLNTSGTDNMAVQVVNKQSDCNPH